MSTEISILLAVLIIGLLAGLGLFLLNRLLADDFRTEGASKSGLVGTVGSYVEVRRQVMQCTPRAVSRPPMPLTPNNVVLLVEELEGEVNNGGFDQFFFNSTGDYSRETVSALERIKAYKTAALLKAACDRFPDGMPPTDISVRREIMLSKVSPNAEAFQELDDRFYAYEDDLGQLIDDYKGEYST